ncbi:MAG: peptide chain release factor 1 [Dehalococcoidia bacterium]|jgi:peptide chain release factor 1|nr:peptide chain release factor 1 [Dehalococcoidia bacterium]MDP7261008.1 peptide chain release factor 1 [Dehalococcoidia bacterium]MDP7486350.1 peptide chain release factor 1 [Dehalococcoidia bacterium]|tara:strand:- start:1765 stop:2847 length:1083 start_codon:yes stop_codon:yes gene_type:complete
MQQSIEARLKEIADRHGEVERLMSQPETASDPNAIRRLGREYSQLQHIVELWNEMTNAQTEFDGAQEMIAEEKDPEVLEMANLEADDLKEKLKSLSADIKLELLPKDETEHADAVVEVRAGAGGDEAGLFAAEVFRMYQRYAESRKWQMKVLSENATGVGGIKEVTFELEGEGAYQRLHLESGVHRVQRVPSTESQGRIHTSTATVAVMPKAEELDLIIADNDINIDVFHSGGAGGQNVNKVATAIRITHLPTGLVVQCQNERSQLQNKLQGMEILRSRLWDMELRKRQAEESANRKAQVGTGDRSEKIRTYNFPQSRITDHRIGYTSHQMQNVMSGQLDDFIDALLQEEQARKLAAVGD